MLGACGVRYGVGSRTCGDNGDLDVNRDATVLWRWFWL